MEVSISPAPLLDLPPLLLSQPIKRVKIAKLPVSVFVRALVLQALLCLV